VGEARGLMVTGDTAPDAVTGKAVAPLPEGRDDVVVNNRLRRTLATAIAAFRLASNDRSVRLAAAKESQNSADEEALPAIAAASAKESDPEIKGLLALTQASIQLASPDRATRLPPPPARGGSRPFARWRKATPARPKRCCWRCWKRKVASSSKPTMKCALKRSARCRTRGRGS